MFVFLQHACLDEFVDELLHGVEGGEEALRCHDEPCMGFGLGRLSFLCRLKCHEIEADHAARKVDLPDAVREEFFFDVCHDGVSDDVLSGLKKNHNNVMRLSAIGTWTDGFPAVGAHGPCGEGAVPKEGRF